MNDQQILQQLARHMSKHGSSAFGPDDEGDQDYFRCVDLLRWFAENVGSLDVPERPSG